MTSKFYHFSLVTLLIILLAGCSKNRLKPDQEEAIEKLEVIVLFSPEGFYNLGYNERFLAGVEKASSKYALSYSFHIPDSVHLGGDIYKEWLDKDLDSETKKSLFIFSSNVYEDLFTELGAPAKKSDKEVLIFDIPHEVPNAYSIHVATYGAAYYAAKDLCEELEILSFFYPDFIFHYFLANKYDMELKRTCDGFMDGVNAFQAAEGITISHDISYISSVYDDIDTKNRYLGYKNEDSAYMSALLKCSINSESFNFLIPIAGASNMGIYRYVSMNALSTMTIGMYVENSRQRHSVVKCMDVVLDDFFKLWVSEEKIPEYRQYSLGSEGVKISLSAMNGYTNVLREDLFQEAIIKEKEYYEKLAK